MPAALRSFFAKDCEPLRRKLYGVLGPLLAILVAKGIITQDIADIVFGGTGYAVLIPAVEWARANVMPYLRKDTGGRHRADVETA